jgi:multidrug resistance protein, MATE family
MNTTVCLFRYLSQNVSRWRHETRAVVRLAAPLALTELAFMAIVATDVIMMGWLGADSLAAGTLAGQYYWFSEFFVLGLLGAIAPILSRHLGARRYRMIRGTVRQGFWLAIIASVPCILMIWYAGSVLVLLGQEPNLAHMSQSYLRYMVIGFLPGLGHFVLAEFLVAHHRPRAVLVITIIGIGVNILADYTFMFGHFGFPAMGLVGAGVASAIVTTLMFLAVFFFVLTDRRIRRYHLFGYFWRVDWPQLREIFTVGFPIALTDMAQFGTFLVASLFMGLISIDALAAHGVTIQCIEIALVVPIGLMQAASVRVGYTVGAGDHRATSRAGMMPIWLGFAYTLLIAAIFLFFGETLVGVYLDATIAENRQATTLAISFLAIGALFFIADSTLTITRGALMGLTDTRVPMMFALGSYGIGLPAAAFFGVYLGYGGQAIWLSLLAPASVLAVILIQRFRSKCKTRVAT